MIIKHDVFHNGGEVDCLARYRFKDGRMGRLSIRRGISFIPKDEPVYHLYVQLYPPAKGMVVLMEGTLRDVVARANKIDGLDDIVEG
jgi:hypothetical protein